jgi:hypothetical protein
MECVLKDTSCNKKGKRRVALLDHVLVVEPEYLPNLEVFCFQPCLYPMKYLHPISMYTLPHDGVQRGVTPFAGFRRHIPPAGVSEGKRAPKGKFPCKCIL